MLLDTKLRVSFSYATVKNDFSINIVYQFLLYDIDL